MSVLMYLVVSTGLLASVVLLVLAMARGRAEPTRRVPWILALVILGIDAALHVASSVGVVLSGGAEGAWFVLGTIGFLTILAVAVLRPRWAGWALLASAAIVPLAFAFAGLTVTGTSAVEQVDAAPPWPVALVAYSVPAAVSGGLLVLSVAATRRADAHTDATGPRTRPAVV